MSDVAAQRRENFLAWMAAMGLNAHRISMEASVPKQTVRDYVNGSTASLRGDNEARIAKAYGFALEFIFGPSDPDDREPSHVTAWREVKGVSLDELAAKAGLPVAMMERIEAGEVPLTGKIQRRVADALEISQGFITLNPKDAANSHLLAADAVPKTQRQTAAAVLAALSATGTDG
jgi:transcriptional regulator with XRE-family HTH domain